MGYGGRLVRGVGEFRRRVFLKVRLDTSTSERTQRDILEHLGQFFWAAFFLPGPQLWLAVRRVVLGSWRERRPQRMQMFIRGRPLRLPIRQ